MPLRVCSEGLKLYKTFTMKTGAKPQALPCPFYSRSMEIKWERHSESRQTSPAACCLSWLLSCSGVWPSPGFTPQEWGWCEWVLPGSGFMLTYRATVALRRPSDQGKLQVPWRKQMRSLRLAQFRVTCVVFHKRYMMTVTVHTESECQPLPASLGLSGKSSRPPKRPASSLRSHSYVFLSNELKEEK